MIQAVAYAVELTPTEIRDFLQALAAPQDGARCDITLRGGLRVIGLITIDNDPDYPVTLWPGDGPVDGEDLLCWTFCGHYWGHEPDLETAPDEDSRDIVCIRLADTQSIES
jgi:hypothetical protein